MDLTDMTDNRSGLRQIWSILLAATVMLAGCAGSGDVEKVRQEQAQAKAKMSAELQQERALAASMEKESEAQKAAAGKLAKALGGKQGMVGSKSKAQSMSLTTALKTTGCIKSYTAIPPNPQAQYTQALYIDESTTCSNVTVGTADATFTAQAPLIPVVIGSGGTLTLQDQAMTLYASSFLIQNGGTMQAGTATTPVQSQITIVMAGNSSAALPPTTGDQNPNARDITVMDGGLLALYGGKGLSAPPDGINNNPAKTPAFINTVSGTKSWTYLAVPAGPSKYNDAENVSTPVPTTAPDTTLTLATTVDWQVNDWISVATTSFSSHQTEIVQICGINPIFNPDPGFSPTPTIPGVPQYTIPGVPKNVSQISLCSSTPLKHYHYGGLAPTPGFFPAKTTQSVVAKGNAIDVSHQARSFYDGSSRNYGIDERAEVALLSRNIKLTSLAGQASDANSFIGGHLVAMVTGATAPTLQLVGVEIEKFGQALVGRYPVHLHKLPSGSNVLVQDVSVHHSYNKCFVVHGTGNANFYNNVCVRTVGQGVYLEDGTNITGNQFMRNFIAGAMAANTTYSYPPAPSIPSSLYWDGDNLQRAHTSATWYTVNAIPDTSNSGANVPLGPDLYHPGGFWITNPGNAFVNNSVAGCQAMGRGYWLLAQNSQLYSYPEFTGNRVHGCYNGIDTQPDAVNASDPKPTMNGSANDHAPVLLLNDNTVTRSRNRGFWGRGIFFALHNNRFATNPYGFSLLGGGGPEGNLPGFWGMAHENVIAGMTRNNVERYPGGCLWPPITNAQSTNGPPTYTPYTTNPNVGTFTVITTSNSPPTGTQVLISGVQGSIQANGTWTITNIDATHFALQLPFNYGTYASGGSWKYTNSAATWQTECTDVALGSGATWGNYPNPVAGSAMNIQGYSYYDGPARIEHNRFVNFRFDPTGIQSDPAARLLTKTDIQNIASFDIQGQLQGIPTPNFYSGYAGDPATGWIQSNAQSVPPTQYIQNSIWDNVDFKHQVYTEAVNLGVFNDGDKTTVILDKDSQLTGLRVVDGSGKPAHDFVPVSLNSVDYYATDFTVDEPHSRGPNDFRATSLMSPHKYATLNIESVDNPPGGIPTTFRVEIKRDMPAYGDTVYPSLFLNGRGQNPIYEPFVMDRMGYSVYGKTGTEHIPSTQAPSAFMNRLLFSYTDPAVHKVGDYFVNRIAVYQKVTTPGNIRVYRIRRQWGQQYTGAMWPPNYNPPGNALTCDSVFFANQANAGTRWQDCLNRATNVAPYTGGITLTPAKDWKSFEQAYKTLMSITNPTPTDIATFINGPTFFYDTTNNMLYFYMIEDSPVQRLPAPYGTCGGGKQQYAANVTQVQQIKSFSDPSSVKAALDASCLVSKEKEEPQPTDLFTCGENGCAAYLVDFTSATVTTPTPCSSPCNPLHPISRTDYSTWNQYQLVYGTSTQQPNGVPVAANPAIGNTAPPQDGTSLVGIKTPVDGTSPPAGDQVTYFFLTLPGSIVPVTENFPYHCVTTPPWAPVNARGTYPPTGGFTYPLLDSVCTPKK